MARASKTLIALLIALALIVPTVGSTAAQAERDDGDRGDITIGVVTPPNEAGVGIDLQAVIAPDRERVCLILVRKTPSGDETYIHCLEVPDSGN